MSHKYLIKLRSGTQLELHEAQTLLYAGNWLIFHNGDEGAPVLALPRADVAYVLQPALVTLIEVLPRRNGTGDRACAMSSLKSLLLCLFQSMELRAFLHLHLGHDGLDVVQSLPASGSSADADAYAAVVALDHRGLLHEGFFDALVSVRPRREQEIRFMQREILSIIGSLLRLMGFMRLATQVPLGQERPASQPGVWAQTCFN